MNIDKLDYYIKENRFEEFKNEISISSVNSHHKNVLLGKCFKSGHTNFIEFMIARSPSNSTILIPYFMECLKSPIKEENLKFFKTIEDVELISHVNKGTIEDIIKNQSENFYFKFIEEFPITSFRNFSGIFYHSFKEDKIHYVKPFEGFQFDYKKCYNFCFCAFEFDRQEIVNDFLIAQIKHNPNLINDLKFHQEELFAQAMQDKQQYISFMKNYHASQAAYALKMASMPVKKSSKNTPVTTSPFLSHKIKAREIDVKKENLNLFINEQIAKAFNDYLEEKFPEKSENKVVKNKKI